MKSTLKNIVATILFSITSIMNVAFAQDELESIDFSGIEASELFSTDEILEMTLKADFIAVTKDNGDEPQYHKATIEYTDQNGQVQSIPLKVKTRGHFRKNSCNCSFPPLKLNFGKNFIENTEFEGQDKIKLVTHCNSRRDIHEQYIIQEYLVYKSYNILTDKSFKVRLARITYEDVNGAMETMTKYGIFIESDEEMASRIGGQLLEAKNVHDDRTDFNTMTLLAVFQYMIGNTDWSVPVLHNIKLVSVNAEAAPIAVGYDFDWSGMVNAYYAEPALMLNLKNVRERAYRGYVRTNEQLNETLKIFWDKKDALFSLYENNAQLDEKQKKQSISYLDEFFKLISKDRFVQTVFIRGARQNNISAR